MGIGGGVVLGWSPKVTRRRYFVRSRDFEREGEDPDRLELKLASDRRERFEPVPELRTVTVLPLDGVLECPFPLDLMLFLLNLPVLALLLRDAGAESSLNSNDMGDS